MRRAMDIVCNRRARVIIMSMAIKGSTSQLRKSIKCAIEQHKRGLYFVLEAIVKCEKDEKDNCEDEKNESIQELANQGGMFVSKECTVMHHEGEHGWVMAKFKVITNSAAIRDNIDKSNVKSCRMKRSDNKWLVNLATEGVKQEAEMTIMGISDSEAFVDEDADTRQYWDDLSGKELDPELVKKAREEEMKEVNKHGVYIKVPIEECWTNTGKDPIGTRWVDVNKGDESNPDYRSRLVAQEIKRDNREDLFAATPPLDAKKMLMGSG
jgi:hypothetical protein